MPKRVFKLNNSHFVFLFLDCFESDTLDAQLANLDASGFTASSSFDSLYLPSNSLLHSTAAYGWWAAQNNVIGEYIQVDLDEVKVIVKVATQGQTAGNQFVTSYELATSSGGDLEYILNEFGNEKLFSGNVDGDTVVENCVGNVQAFAVRMYPQTWYQHISLRWELYALPEPGE